MNDYYKYLPVSEEDENWGLCVLSTGCGRIGLSDVYPRKDHPSHHYFNWAKGRILHEYQLIYITKGEGVFESAHCSQKIISEGTIIMLFPGEWHRYEPSAHTGWYEHWVGFKGTVIENLIRKKFFSPENPSLSIGFNEKVMNIFLEIIERSKDEKTGYQQLISGALLHLLGYIYSAGRLNNVEEKTLVEGTINKAKVLLRENIDTDISIEKIAEELQVGYSWFRKIFKAYTGMAPGQYLIQLKIEKSKELLADPEKSIKQIAYELKFDTNFYFSKLFKEKTGLTPAAFRKKSDSK
jgi:AraC-like DNA-binding protein